ncbi:MAG TPA: YifB family Mg chelatase-like AAA ATPase, partial [Vicinamibacterales bacterium]|nr:YifB family Mg chelatase-like AAA ATPase [Vicinamibacterales bacterium]
MLARVLSAALRGIEAFPVSVEVDVTFGLPVFAMVGLPDASVRESRDRVRAAIRNSGYDFPPHRITVNLAPADVRKGGAAFDLPIAVAILAAAGVLPCRDARRLAVVGELSLDGAVLPTRGVLPVAASLRRQGIEALVLADANAAEAAVVAGLAVLPVRTLAEAVARLQQAPSAWPVASTASAALLPAGDTDCDLVDVRGQSSARRALEVAAAGGHHLLLVGPPGAGKTMLARRLPGVLPPLTFDEALEATAVHSVAGLLPAGAGLIGARPFRAPHHSASAAALVGGGSQPRPGDVTLAHHGVLFLDELPEFGRHVLESLRQPLEEGRVHVSRATGTVTFPAAFTLVAAMNPCPCGGA